MAEEKEFTGLWIPKEVLLDSNLSVNEKLILAEIMALNNEDGCIASNQYLSDNVCLSQMQGRRAIYSLAKKQYIEATIIRENESNKVQKRVIRPMCKNAQRVCADMHKGGVQNCTEGMYKNAQRVCADMNTPYVQKCTVNNIDNNISNSIEDSIENTTTTEEAWKKVVGLYQDCIHMIPNKVEADDLRDLYEEHGADWCIEAIKEGARKNARSIKYISAILNNWKMTGLAEPWKNPKVKVMHKQSRELTHSEKAYLMGEEAIAMLEAQQKAEKEAMANDNTECNHPLFKAIFGGVSKQQD